MTWKLRMLIIVNLPMKKLEYRKINSIIVLIYLKSRLPKLKKCMENNTICCIIISSIKVKLLAKLLSHSSVKCLQQTKNLSKRLQSFILKENNKWISTKQHVVSPSWKKFSTIISRTTMKRNHSSITMPCINFTSISKKVKKWAVTIKKLKKVKALKFLQEISFTDN